MLSAGADSSDGRGLRPIQLGQKYACLALTLPAIAPDVPSAVQLAPGVWATRSAPLGLPDHWRDWLGSLDVQALEEANFFIVAASDARVLELLDDDNQILSARVNRHYHGLLVSSTGIEISGARLLTGGFEREGISVRSTQQFPLVHQLDCIPLRWSLLMKQIRDGAEVAEGIARAREAGDVGRIWRMLHTFYAALQSRDLGVRFHQLVRTVEGISIPPQGGAGKTFAKRTAQLTGEPAHFAPLFEELYAIRGKLEHLHDPRAAVRTVLATRSPAVRAQVESDAGAFEYLLQITMLAEALAHACLRRILTRPSLLKFFSADMALEALWSLDGNAFASEWGDNLSAELQSVAATFDETRVQILREDQQVDSRIGARVYDAEVASRAFGRTDA